MKEMCAKGLRGSLVVSGTLLYTVYRGGITVWRGPADGTQTKVRDIEAGRTGAIHAGEGLVETAPHCHPAPSPPGRASRIAV